MNKYLVILRGVSGAGKSTYAKKLLLRVCRSIEGNFWRRSAIVSADNYFIRPDGKYDFNAKSLGNAHAWCYSQVNGFMKLAVRVIILDNTNTQKWEYEKYVELAKQNGYIVKERIIGNTDEESLKLYASRNTHGVPEQSIRKMAQRFEK